MSGTNSARRKMLQYDIIAFILNGVKSILHIFMALI